MNNLLMILAAVMTALGETKREDWDDHLIERLEVECGIPFAVIESNWLEPPKPTEGLRTLIHEERAQTRIPH